MTNQKREKYFNTFLRGGKRFPRGSHKVQGLLTNLANLSWSSLLGLEYIVLQNPAVLEIKLQWTA